ncbi:response regulator [Anoxynatronum buryatiense]|uniref:Stage 0 sporulation protein A homolog n=1 Tax=Anoxynatronum buryatiense TaxID=489973 RepID=A0AA46AJ82_9CLOT|nr:response regulator [Anoxynatronum buryatiense]SMP57889.1 two-component system, chemotaxis family, response regulator CheY [Anoxynatronum buryatiense]
MRILICDDHDASRIVLSKYLARYGTCTLVDNGAEAISLYAESQQSDEPFQLVCIDILMPQMDGFNTLRSIRELEKVFSPKDTDKLKVIMVTALDDTDNIHQAYSLGCDAYLMKPYTLQQVDDTLKSLGLIT